MLTGRSTDYTAASCVEPLRLVLCFERFVMKTIGLIGGMSWESSLVYYRLINEAAKERLGGFQEVVGTFHPEGACAEASRCLRCDLEKVRS